MFIFPEALKKYRMVWLSLTIPVSNLIITQKGILHSSKKKISGSVNNPFEDVPLAAPGYFDTYTTSTCSKPNRINTQVI